MKAGEGNLQAREEGKVLSMAQTRNPPTTASGQTSSTPSPAPSKKGACYHNNMKEENEIFSTNY